MDFRKICEDYRISIAPAGHRHQRKGWINVECPFCTGNPGYHLGYEEGTKGNGFVCYRCGGHGAVSTIAALLRVTYENAREIIETYGGKPYAARLPKIKEYKYHTNIKEPCRLLPLGTKAQKYLEKRNFDPEKISKMFGVMQTGPVGWLSHRLYIPIKYHGYTISYTCRSYAGSGTRYLSCPQSQEAIPHKDNLYFIDEVPGRSRIVILEGCTDVWRMGPGSVATFGSKVTPAQLKLMCCFQRVVLFRDLDEAGERAWAQVGARLRFAGVRLDIVSPEDVGDAAELPQNEADYLMRTL